MGARRIDCNAVYVKGQVVTGTTCDEDKCPQRPFTASIFMARFGRCLPVWDSGDFKCFLGALFSRHWKHSRAQRKQTFLLMMYSLHCACETSAVSAPCIQRPQPAHGARDYRPLSERQRLKTVSGESVPMVWTGNGTYTYMLTRQQVRAFRVWMRTVV